MADELRAYFFNNMYLTSIHAGIQSQHTTAEMFLKYKGIMSESQNDINAYFTLYGWAKNYKTTIVLNGGYSSNLHDICELLDTENNPYPWAYFCESEEALDGAITNVGIVIPDKIFNFFRNEVEWVDRGNDVRDYHKLFTGFEIQLAGAISKCKLMT